MRCLALPLVVAAAAGLVACGDDEADDRAADGDARVRIESVRLVGSAATLAYVVSGTNAEAAITIDWGDGSALQGFRGGEGPYTSSHRYDTGLDRATVTVTLTAADGSIAADATAVELGRAGPTSTATASSIPAPAPSTTSASPPTTVTPTTPSTTAPARASTTTTTTTSTTSTTSTTLPYLPNSFPVRLGNGTIETVEQFARSGRTSSSDVKVTYGNGRTDGYDLGDNGLILYSRCNLIGVGETSFAEARVEISKSDVIEFLTDEVGAANVDRYSLEYEFSSFEYWELDRFVDDAEWGDRNQNRRIGSEDDRIQRDVAVSIPVAELDDEHQLVRTCELANDDNFLSFGSGYYDGTLVVVDLELRR